MEKLEAARGSCKQQGMNVNNYSFCRYIQLLATFRVPRIYFMWSLREDSVLFNVLFNVLFRSSSWCLVGISLARLRRVLGRGLVLKAWAFTLYLALLLTIQERKETGEQSRPLEIVDNQPLVVALS